MQTALVKKSCTHWSWYEQVSAHSVSASPQCKSRLSKAWWYYRLCRFYWPFHWGHTCIMTKMWKQYQPDQFLLRLLTQRSLTNCSRDLKKKHISGLICNIELPEKLYYYGWGDKSLTWNHSFGFYEKEFDIPVPKKNARWSGARKTKTPTTFLSRRAHIRLNTQIWKPNEQW
jgi:hypothetical protein